MNGKWAFFKSIPITLFSIFYINVSLSFVSVFHRWSTRMKIFGSLFDFTQVTVEATAYTIQTSWSDISISRRHGILCSCVDAHGPRFIKLLKWKSGMSGAIWFVDLFTFQLPFGRAIANEQSRRFSSATGLFSILMVFIYCDAISWKCICWASLSSPSLSRSVSRKKLQHPRKKRVSNIFTVFIFQFFTFFRCCC